MLCCLASHHILRSCHKREMVLRGCEMGNVEENAWLNKSRHWSSPLIKVPFKPLPVWRTAAPRDLIGRRGQWLPAQVTGQSLRSGPRWKSCCCRGICLPRAYFGVYLPRKDGFELQRLLTTIRKSHQYCRSFQISAGQYLTVHLFVFLLPWLILISLWEWREESGPPPSLPAQVTGWWLCHAPYRPQWWAP